MELIEKIMTALFEQLGEISDDASISQFMELHGQLPGGTLLHEATFWSASQAFFLHEAISLEAAWALVVDELNADLHWRPSAPSTDAPI